MENPGNFVEPHPFSTQKGELHLFVIWEHGRHKQDEILRDIQQHLTILDCFDMRWDWDTVVKSFGRLYNQGFFAGWRRFRERGGGRFLLITVWDDHPVYEFEEALAGHEVVNSKMLHLKKKYRSWVNRRKGNCVHCSTRPWETNHDLTLILGRNTEDYLSSVQQSWDGRFQRLDQNMLGAKGWKDIGETLYALNNTVDYAVMRNYGELSLCNDGSQRSPFHSDVDLLVSDRKKTLSILNPCRRPARLYCPIRNNCVKVRIGGRIVPWDIRHVGDDYYCADWENDMLKNRVFHTNEEGSNVPRNQFYCLDDENYFFSLVYHALIHKYEIANDYYEKARLLFDRLQASGFRLQEETSGLRNFDLYFKLLKDFMKRKGYFFAKPRHPRVGYNEAVLSLERVAKQLTERFSLTDVEPVHVNQYQLEIQRTLRTKVFLKKDHSLYFQGTMPPAQQPGNGRKVFIKAGGYYGTKKSEYHCLLKCFQKNPRNFPEPLFYYDSGELKCVATEWLEGEQLDVLLRENRMTAAEKESVELQIWEIAQTLCDVGIAHRDVAMKNLMVDPQGNVKLFDFGWGVEIDDYKEILAVRRWPLLYTKITKKHQTPDRFHSDDMYALLQVVNRFRASDFGLQEEASGLKSDPEELEETCRRVESFLEKRVGRHAVPFKYKYLMIAQFFLNRFLRASLCLSELFLYFPVGTGIPALASAYGRWAARRIYYID